MRSPRATHLVILCRTREEAEAALEDVRAWVSENGLALHPEKTRVGDCRQPGQGFEFLGYRFEAGQRHVRKKSLTKLKDSIRAKTKRTRGDTLARIVADLNSLLRGWFAYFKHAHKDTFERLDGFTRRRLRALLRRQEKRSSGMGLCRADNRRWPNAFFAEAGLFALHTAWLSARQVSMKKLPTGEPYAGCERKAGMSLPVKVWSVQSRAGRTGASLAGVAATRGPKRRQRLDGVWH